MRHYLQALIAPESVALVGASERKGSLVCVVPWVRGLDVDPVQFASGVTDTWQHRGVANVLMSRLIACARHRGLASLQGTILRENEPMLAFVRRLGFVVADDPEDAAQVLATLALG